MATSEDNRDDGDVPAVLAKEAPGSIIAPVELAGSAGHVDSSSAVPGDILALSLSETLSLIERDLAVAIQGAAEYELLKACEPRDELVDCLEAVLRCEAGETQMHWRYVMNIYLSARSICLPYGGIGLTVLRTFSPITSLVQRTE